MRAGLVPGKEYRKEAEGGGGQGQSESTSGGSQDYKGPTRRFSHKHLLSSGEQGPWQWHTRKNKSQEAATLLPEAGPWGGSVMGGRNRAFNLPDRLAISGSCAS